MTTPAQPNTLSSDVEIKGSIKFEKDLFIDGKVEGEIVSPGALVLGAHADIHGEIRTKSVTLEGNAQANITVDDRCELKTGSHLIGDLKAARLVIEEGATFVGKSEVNPTKIPIRPEPPRAPEPAKPAAPVK